jgi:tetratricopeptide (TPR) repeat protein
VLPGFRAFLKRSRAARSAFTVAALVVIGLCAFRVGRHFWADKQLHAARTALDLGRVPVARALLLSYLELRPDDPEVHLLLGRAARRLGDYAAAEQHLLHAKRLGGVSETIQLERLLQDVQRGNGGAAEGQLWRYTEHGHPDSLDILEALARGYLVTYRLDLAQKAADRLLELQPNLAPAWVLRGKALYHMRRYSEATDNYAQAVQLAPDDVDIRLLLAQSLLENAQPAEALVHFDQLREQSPDPLAVLVGRAHCLIDLGRTDEAGEALDRALAQAPDHIAGLVLRGKLAMRQLDLAAAERALRRAVALDGTDRDAVYNLSLCLQQQHTNEKQDEAAKWLRQFRQIEADQRRLSTLTKQILAAPHNPALRCEAGAIFLHLGNDKEGLRWLNSALQVDAHHVQSHEILRDYYRGKGQTELARFHERALQK